MHRNFINFLESIKTDSNSNILDAVISGYNIIFEGIGDVDMISKINSIFTKICNAIRSANSDKSFHNIYFVTISVNGIVITNKDEPNITFGFTGSNHFDKVNNRINININKSLTEYKKLYETHNYINLSNLINSYISPFIHEYRHYLDSLNKGNRHKFSNNYIIERSDKINQFLVKLKAFADEDEEIGIYTDMDYFNNQTEKNEIGRAHV